jgi:hypothetical protein
MALLKLFFSHVATMALVASVGFTNLSCGRKDATPETGFQGGAQAGRGGTKSQDTESIDRRQLDGGLAQAGASGSSGKVHTENGMGGIATGALAGSSGIGGAGIVADRGAIDSIAGKSGATAGSSGIVPVGGVGGTMPGKCTGAEPTSDTLHGLAAMARPELLPIFKKSIEKEVSSADPTGANQDYSNFVSVSGNTAVLADIEGPGCIERIWTTDGAVDTGLALQGQIRFFLDDEVTPRIDCPYQDFFLGKCPPFVSPLVGRSSGGFYSYMPIAFAKRARVELENPNLRTYYQITYHVFPAGTPVTSFTATLSDSDQKLLAAVIANWNRAGDEPSPSYCTPVIRDGSFSLKPGARHAFVDESAPGTIRLLKLMINPALTSSEDLQFHASWDGESSPSIEAPVVDFFGYGFGDARYKSLPLAMRGDGYYAFFPMPYAQSAQLSLTNTGPTERTVTWMVQIDPAVPDMSYTGHFHARTDRTTSAAGEPITLADINGGRGHLVGVSLNQSNPLGIAEPVDWTGIPYSSGFLEGDHAFFVDGEIRPSLAGTGTEDFFNSGWYYRTGAFYRPLHGALLVDASDKPRYSVYRWLIPDYVPFTESLRITLEHAPQDNSSFLAIDYWWTIYYYQ